MQKRIIIKIIFCLILFISAIAAIIIKLNSDKPKVGISRFELYCKTINVDYDDKTYSIDDKQSMSVIFTRIQCLLLIQQNLMILW